MKKKDSILVLIGILFISFNLRAPITAVGSLVSMIKADYGLSNAVAGFITTLPLIAFAIVSPFVAKLSVIWGEGRTMMLGLLFILLGEFIRSYTGVAGLFIGTAIIGIGIAIGNVLIPAIIKKNFSERVGMVTSIYTSGMCIYAAVGAGISVPLAKGMNLGWKNALASWFILTIITMIIWLPQSRRKAERAAVITSPKSSTSVWKSPLAWWVTIFMGIQSLLFYSQVAWLPTIVMSKGMTAGYAGNMALLFQLMAIPATIVLPAISDRFKHQKGLVIVTCLIYLAGMLLFLISSTEVLIILSVILLSLGMGGSISLSIAFISMRSPNHRKASELSGMSQSAGYLLAAIGPIMAGGIYDSTGSWTLPIILFAVLIVLLALSGLEAGSNKHIAE